MKENTKTKNWKMQSVKENAKIQRNEKMESKREIKDVENMNGSEENEVKCKK